MQKAHLIPSWGLRIALLLCIGLTSSGAFCAEQEDIMVKLVQKPFSEVIQILADISHKNLVMLAKDDTLIDLNVQDFTPLDDILNQLTLQRDLIFWKKGDVYYIGKPSQAPSADRLDVRSNAPSAEVTTSTTSSLSTLDAPVLANPPREASIDDTITAGDPEKLLVRKIYLKHSSASQMCWAFGLPNYQLTDQHEQRIMRNRIRTIFDPREVRNIREDSGNYESPGLGNAWFSNANNDSSLRSTTDSDQYAPPAGYPGVGAGSYPLGGGTMYPGTGSPYATGAFPGTYASPYPAGGAGAYPAGAAGAYPNYPGYPGTNQQGYPTSRNPLNPYGQNNQLRQTGLRAFLPDGIQNIVGLPGLNAILVQAKSEEAIEQLEKLIKLLDQPVKQAVIEVMFVRMTINDAMNIGAQLQVSGSPISILTNNAGGGGNKLSYMKGNLIASIQAMVTDNRVKVVQAPRVIVQNGGGANIQFTQSIPFIIVNENEDIFNRKTSTPTIEMQEFNQGLTVQQITIHPDNTLTLLVDPVLESPGQAVKVPGGSGEVSGTSSQRINTILRVKNGETIMMGGFVGNNETTASTKTPILGDIPIIGPLLFKSRSKNVNNIETMIFLTPTIIEEDSTDFGGMATLPPLF